MLQTSQWLLSARSPVFCQMFTADMEEAKSKRVSIEDFDADVVEQFVRFIHTDSIILTLKTSWRDLFLIADKYDVCGLKDLAQKQLIECLSVETVCEMFEFATSIANAEALQAACSEYIRKIKTPFNQKAVGKILAKTPKLNFFILFF